MEHVAIDSLIKNVPRWLSWGRLETLSEIFNLNRTPNSVILLNIGRLLQFSITARFNPEMANCGALDSDVFFLKIIKMKSHIAMMPIAQHLVKSKEK